MTATIRAVAVGVPARDEDARIAGCLASLEVAVVAASRPASIVVAADACHDSTAAVASSSIDGRSGAARLEVVECDFGRVGPARNLACRRAIDRLVAAGFALDTIWLATTDADSRVPADWITRQLRWAAEGADGVAGLVRLSTFDRLALVARGRWARVVNERGVGMGHPHVHGANLGLRATTWLGAGGFGPEAVGEDEALWRRAAAVGAVLLGVDDVVVTTSARTSGRAPAGLSTMLAELDGTV